jgi:hypothetical protein
LAFGALNQHLALNALREDTREWWEEQLTREQDDYDEDQTPYRAGNEGLKRFLESEVLPWYEKRIRELDRPRSLSYSDADASSRPGSA